jgi:hypothetical protein
MKVKKIKIHLLGVHVAGELDAWFDLNRFYCDYCDAEFKSRRKRNHHVKWECERSGKDEWVRLMGL